MVQEPALYLTMFLGRVNPRMRDNITYFLHRIALNFNTYMNPKSQKYHIP